MKNCKPGDLAIVINGGCIGRLVNVVHPSIWGGTFWFVEFVGGKGPTTDCFTGMQLQSSEGNICDSRLRPIRDQPGEDQTLSWAALPNEQEVPA